MALNLFQQKMIERIGKKVGSDPDSIVFYCRRRVTEITVGERKYGVDYNVDYKKMYQGIVDALK